MPTHAGPLPVFRTVPSPAGRLALASLAVTVAAFLLYRWTLLPGLDFGDTAAFQNAGGSLEATPRQSYPLYFALGNLVVWAARGEPAYGMNLASALAGAVACGLVTYLIGTITGSVAGALTGGLLLAGSYTFWSQAVIAEVYALHVAALAASLVALVWWGRTPGSLRRLAVFFVVYALGFGNHLMMLLLAPAAVVYIALMAGARTLVAPRVVGVAALAALLGALQYAWNFVYLWSLPDPPASIGEGLRIFWFDVTKADWRETLVLGIGESGLSSRWPMYFFDLRQQVGLAGIALAVVGTAALARSSWRLTLALLTGYATALAFAITYNVGDVHVFLLPSHLFVILAAGCGAAALVSAVRHAARRGAAVVAALAVLALPAWRIADTYPAVDRSGDRRPVERLAQITSGLSPETSILLAELNWQAQNGLDYYARHLRPEINVLRPGSRMLSLPRLIEENRIHGREVVMTSTARASLEAAYGGLFAIEPDRRAPLQTLASRLAQVRSGMPYVLAVLGPRRALPIDVPDLREACARLTAGRTSLPLDDVYMYVVMAGVAGEPARFVRASRRPFRATVQLGGIDVDVRMESWLAFDTMRRAGFGHVVADGRHVLTLERGASFVALHTDGRPEFTAYAWGLFAPEPRYRIAPARQ